MEYNKKWIILLVACFALLVTGTFVCQFHTSGISTDPSDWNIFASYLNGMLMPVLTFVNILVLLGVGQAVYDLSIDKKKHIDNLKRYNNRMNDFKVQVNPDATVEDNLKELDKHIERIQELFSFFQKSDEQCEKDLYELAEKAKMSIRGKKALHDVPYYENPFVNRMWEMHNIGVTNAMTLTAATILQLKVNVFELMAKQNPGNAEVHKKYTEAQKTLEEFCKESQVVD